MDKYNINGVEYEFDWNNVTVRDAMMLKTATGLNMRPLMEAFFEVDPDVLAALGWLLLTKAGVKGPDGEPIQLKDVDFTVSTFSVEEPEPEPEPTDPTRGEGSSPIAASDSTSSSTAASTA